MKKSWLSLLSPEEKNQIEKIYLSFGFENYDEITEQINSQLVIWGYDLTISRSTVNRAGKHIEKYIELSRQWKHLGEVDLGTELSTALLTVAQTKALGMIDNDDELDPEVRIKLFNAASTLSKANVTQKRFLNKFIEDTKAKLEKNLNTYATKKGLPKQEVDDLRKALMHDLPENEST